MNRISALNLVAISLAVAGCSSSSPKSLPAGSYFVSGIYQGGPTITEPRPVQSSLMAVTKGGFQVADGTAAYVLRVTLSPDLPEQFFARATFENPQDFSEPFVEEGEFLQRPSILTPAHGPVSGLVMFREYRITVELFMNKGDSAPLDTLTQTIRSYVDTQGEEPLVYSEFAPAK